MATPAVARDTVFALRREIARIEGRLAQRLASPGDDAIVLRGSGRVLGAADRLATGVAALDSALGGGLPRAALTEVHGRQVRDAGAAAGFVLALVALLMKQADASGPLLWIGTGDMFAEAGFPHLHGIARLFGIAAGSLLFAEAQKPVDALRIAEEAAALKSLAAVVLELSGNPQRLDLDATRRLHRRAVQADRPVLLMRHSAEARPTAAPLRFVVAPAPAAPRRILGRPLAGSIGPPAFTVILEKNRLAPPTRLVMEWNPDDLSFEQRPDARQDGMPDPVALVSLSRHGADMAAAARPRMAYGMLRFPAAGRQP
jgi:protein ImuA